MSDPSSAITLINTYNCQPERQAEVMEALRDLTKAAQRLPGFRSARLHRSVNGRHVVNYAEWDSVDAWRAMVRDPSVQPVMSRLVSLATFEPHTYQAAEIYGPAN
jgi:heme-degrading monooxygenase HmoA